MDSFKRWPRVGLLLPCTTAKPCSNGACCGGSGYCGYGPTYCGTGCVSQCNAVAECGQYAKIPGTTCPLNTCCSEFGFCGTTKDFCTGKCQSNCVLDPPPPSDSAKSQALSKVIGYYESWSYTSKCNKKSPSDLPLSELTHLNYAFAYIDPSTYELTTMDSATPESLFYLTAEAKKYNSQLKVFVSVGGWTFSDNGTVTQPLFGEVASSEGNRQKFADNVEYPGAPDRGGKPEDTENFTLLMKTLRSTFSAAPRSLGLTFTTPSSYCASQISMGFGFYGRSFQLSSSGCSTPGCAFKGGASPGPCSATSGILMYYEIQAILKQLPNLKPTLDKDAAVKYIIFDNDQWVSYDDGDTFSTKIAWANTVGIGGSLIWAVDTDDDKFSAMSGFLGKQVSHVDELLDHVPATSLAVTTQSVVSNLVGENGQDCRVLKKYACRHKDDLRCDKDEKLIGWDRDGCDYGKPICCPKATAPSNCQWRGSGGDCNGQCHVGEATLFGSSWCSRGYKIFCCEAGDWKDVVDGCRWTTCYRQRKTAVIFFIQTVGFSRVDFAASNDVLLTYITGNYCCPKDTPLHDCTWRGSRPDCPDAKCKSDEVAVRNDGYGDASWGCSWGRKKTDCCQVSKPPVVSNVNCDITTCDIEPKACDVDNTDEYGNYKREASAVDDNEVPFEKRGPKRTFTWLSANRHLIEQVSRSYTSPDGYMRNLRNSMRDLATSWYQMRSRSCDDPAVAETTFSSTSSAPRGGQVEHPIPLVTLSRFAAVANHGRQWRPAPGNDRINPSPDGPQTRTSPIADDFWRNVWQSANALPSDLPPVSDTSPGIQSPVQRLYERLGSTTNQAHFVLLRDAVNAVKGRVEIFNRPMSQSNFNRWVRFALNGGGSVDGHAYSDEESVEAFMAPLRETVGMFEYLRSPEVVTRIDNVAAGLYNDLQLIERSTPGSEGLSAHWNEFYPHYFGQVSAFARTWTGDQIRYVRAQYQASTSPYRDYVLSELKKIENKIRDMKYEFED
ncbi:hypothetical protein GGR52DRAFT_586914 [Hypoxylon sp. FL1284]|nr:hypothetical protein GGR52DRAFT_586914 [Hypoxylon sp. FL1284]